MKHADSYWERLVNSRFSDDRWQALKAGYGLERFVHDNDYFNRAEVARQGFGLDLLSRDPEPYVQKTVREYLEKHELTLEDWIRENPDKCVYPLMKQQMQDAGLQVICISLLTVKEVEKYASIIPKWEGDFWIDMDSGRTVYDDYHAFTAGPNLTLSPSSESAEHNFSEIRPVLTMFNERGTKFQPGEKLSLLGNTWTVLGSCLECDVLLLADKSFGYTTFGKTGPYYETSDIKKRLDGWLQWKLGDDERKPSLDSTICHAQSHSNNQHFNPNFKKQNVDLER